MRPILHLSVLLLIVSGIAVDSVSLSAQSQNTTRQRAFELYKQDKHLRPCRCLRNWR